MSSRAKHVVVISYDAFSEDQWEKASKLPHLSGLIKSGSYTNKLKSVYPTLTYVVHSTMVTGVYPDKHGIYHNNPLQPFVKEKDQSWFWFRKDIKVPTIYDAVKEHGLRTAGFLWPVTGKASLRYNIPEIRAIKNENQAIKILKNGSPLLSIHMEKKYGHIRRGIEQPFLDNFTTKCATDTIKRKKPNLLLMHLIDLDDAKHENGIDSVEVEKVLLRMDVRLGEIIAATKAAGIFEDTVFIVIGDHGQINIRYKVRLNQLFQAEGLIYEKEGQMKWRAYVQNAGGSAYLHIKANDKEAEQRALKILKQAIAEDTYGIEKLHSREELDKLRIEPSIAYMLEAKKGYCFDDGLEGSIVMDLESKGEKYATHGFSPDKPDYRCNLVISGTGIKNEYDMGDIQMIDIAPTIAEIMGINFYRCDGSPRKDIFL